jgi:hypothetical protein
MKIVFKIHSKIVGDYTTEKIKVKSLWKIIPREGERFTHDSKSYDVKNVHYDYDNNIVTISCL